jgi:hypothetical protein
VEAARSTATVEIQNILDKSHGVIVKGKIAIIQDCENKQNKLGMATNTPSHQKPCEEDEDQTATRCSRRQIRCAERFGTYSTNPRATSDLRRTDWEATRPGGVPRFVVSKPKPATDVPQRLFSIPLAFKGYLAQTIAKAKGGKTVGPDGIPTELWKMAQAARVEVL